MLALTVVTGLVDAFSYLVLGHVFVANMTGNVVFAGFALAGATGFSLAASAAALVAFAAGALLGGRIAHRGRAHRGRLLSAALTLETVLVIGALAVAVLAPAARYPLVALLGAAMGVQNAAARALAVPDLTTTVLTMTVTGIAADSRAAGGPGGKTGRRLTAMLAMFAGALAGATLVGHGSPALPLLAGAVLLAAATAAAFAVSRGSAGWTEPL
jgi:uncharacterized membrane protein YoaK (UPF0700 family)